MGIFKKIGSEAEFKFWILQEIDNRGLGMAEVSEETGLSRTKFWRWRAGQKGVELTFGDYIRLCKYFGVEIVIMQESK